VARVVKHGLRLPADGEHGRHGGDGVLAAQRFRAEQDRVDAVQDRVRHIRRLRPRRPRRGHHGIDDARHEDGLARAVGRRGGRFLDERHLLRRRVQPQVAARQDDAVGGVQDGVEFEQGLAGFQFGQDAGRRAAAVGEAV